MVGVRVGRRVGLARKSWVYVALGERLAVAVVIIGNEVELGLEVVLLTPTDDVGVGT